MRRSSVCFATTHLDGKFYSEMCFTYGSEVEVKAGRGEVVNVVVEKCANEAG